ncbi:DNA cytosine methyltransferase [Cellulosimicrobium cellulans]|uniref:DNA cytosine methyltransferase n=1 Tax=Cellulosimicrobium cellulans TaxID=1710 RepID=UPI000B25A715|nr:DNA (cytosine-5-)-methyltransferase [Cellulosimicrobium cellulans]
MSLSVVEICAGAGGQSLGLELAGFEHKLAVELDENAAATLKRNRREWDVAIGDVADKSVWNPEDPAFRGVDLLAGGVPCPPFSIAGKQLGANDERDLFAWAVELAGRMKPRALLLENVRGLSMPRFAGYRQHVKDRLKEMGYWSDWKLLEARDYGVPQLRPRFVLVAINSDEAGWFDWPEETPFQGTVGTALGRMMGANGWKGAKRWADNAEGIAPTIVGGSKRHGGADLGPTRAKAAWAALGVDAHGVADEPPEDREYPVGYKPKLTTEMVARIQGWEPGSEYDWAFTGRKTSRYRQIGNAFPPPVARAVGESIARALGHEGERKDLTELEAEVLHDPIYTVLKHSTEPLTSRDLIRKAGGKVEAREFERRMAMLSRDFVIEEAEVGEDRAYLLTGFKGFVGQDDHERHLAFVTARSKIS